MADIQEIKKLATDADIPLRELGKISGITYSRICDAFRGWTELKDPELSALENALAAAVKTRADKFNKLLSGIPQVHAVAV